LPNSDLKFIVLFKTKKLLTAKAALDGRFLHNKNSTKIENKTSTILPALPKYFGSNWRVRGQSASTF
jgi:hypothetical protein